ncbi:phospholipid-transporting ATPase ABCA1-like isoform X2 [Apostichopus japonicus]|uniref:phospholipid-transporting ATPase ABCA1-like isoform X2 n=1 Tax=Stichopus japonicus TaxID=307972 RepID=UPI003AB481BF
MKFTRQLFMLCWKNYTTRKRKKVRLAVELVWPVILAVMICLLRLFSHRTFKHECHFASNALPSAGSLPFAQTLICNTVNNCYDHALRGEMSGEISDFQDAGISRLFKDIEELLSNETFITSWTEVVTDLGNVQKNLSLLDSANSAGGQPLSSTLKDPEEMKDYLVTSKNINANVSDAVLSIPVSSEFSQSLLKGQKLPPEDCWSKVDEVLKESEFNKQVQTEFCQSLSQEDYQDISSKLQKQVDPVKFLNGLMMNGDEMASLKSTPLSDILVNSSEVMSYMVNDLGLSSQSSYVLLNESVTPREMRLLLSGSNMSSEVCNETTLASYFPSATQEDISELSKQLCNATSDQLNEFSEELRSHIDKSALADLPIDSNDSLEDQAQEQLQKLMKDIEDLQSFQNLLVDIAQLTNVTDNQEFFCGNLTGTIFDALTSNSSSGSAGSSFQAGGLKNVASGGDKEDPDENGQQMSQCDWVNNLLNQTNGRFIWDRLKPVIQGYILYYPDTSGTAEVIEKAKEPLETIKTMNDVALKWLEYSPTIHNALNQSINFGSCQDELVVLEELVGPEELTSGINKDEILDFVNSMDKFSTALVDAMKCVELDKFVAYETEDDMLNRAAELAENNTFWAAINLTSFVPGSDDVPPYIDYKIRMTSDVLESTHKLNDRFWQPKPRIRSKYIDSGFIYIQDMIESGILQVQTGMNRTQIGLWYHQFPYPCYVDDNFLLILDGMLPLMMTLAWVFSVAMIIKSIVFEKERRLKEVMKVMGLENGVHWLAWFIDSFIMMTISSVLLVIIFKFGKITIVSDPLVVLFFLVSFSVSTIMLCFLISVLFSKANLAAACGAVFYFLTYIPYVMVYVRDERLTRTTKIAVSLLNTIAFGYGTRYLALFEIQGEGAQWWNINTSPLNGDSNMTFIQVIGMMWLDAFIYWILTWYIEAVHPGHYGIPRPLYFPFTRSYWCGYQPPKNQDNLELNQCEFNPHDALNANFEEEPSQLNCGVIIKSMVKVYKTGKKVAVDNLNLKFYENQITSFLGHNGAGKTTTMSILTGLFPPTSGNAYIYGKSILTDIDEIRKSLGMCPQHNVLFDNLTVAEHLWFFARLKGLPPKQVKAESLKMLEDLQLPQKKDELPSALSGGMKRKLSIAIAFLGGAKCVILDEPTAGVDPYSRREIWDLLNKYRQGRTVIMSTHHMDEADVLGDRIAIIANGKLKCCGSSLFLKGRYGSGYYLVLTKETTSMQLRQELAGGYSIDENTSEEVEIEDVGYCNEAVITSFIQRFVPGVQLCENIGQEISYLLPFGAIKAGGFQNLFAQLEKHAKKLHIKNFGISDTSLEEVFLTVAEESAEFREGDIDLGTDSGLLPRPFMGRGSLRRRGYQLPNITPTIDRDDVGLLQSDYSDQDHQSQAMPVRLEDDKDSALGDESLDEERNSKENPGQEESVGGASEVPRHNPRHFGHRRQVSFGSRPDPVLQSGGIPEDLLELRHLKVKGAALGVQQYAALILKRFKHTSRSLKGFLAQVILPAVFILFAMIFSTLKGPIQQPQSLLLAPWIYQPESNVLYSNENGLNALSNIMEEELTNGSGIGTRCTAGDHLKDDGFPCEKSGLTDWVKPQYPKELLEEYLNGSLMCSCSTGFQKCPDDAEGPSPSYRVLQTTDTLHNLTSMNLSDYVIKTTEDFILKRFGGMSFLLENELATLQANETEALIDDWILLNETLANLPQCSSESQDANLFGGQIRKLRKRSSGVAIKSKLFSQIYLPEQEFFDELYEVILSMAKMKNTKIWYNNNGYHALPIYINVMNNLLLRSSINKSSRSAYGITLRNHPINYTVSQLENELMTQIFVNQFIAQFVMFGFAFVPAGFVIYIITERVNNAKHLQIVSGVNPVIYWLSTFSWDLVNFLIPMLLTIVIFFICQLDAFVGRDVFPSLLLLFILYGWASIPMAYPLSMFFQVPSTGYLSVGCLNIILGMVTVMTNFIISYQARTDEDLVLWNNILQRLFLIFPPFCLGEGLVSLSTNHFLQQTYEHYQINKDPLPNPLEWDQLGRNLAALALEGLLFFILTLLLEYNFFYKPRPLVPPVSTNNVEDDDVMDERQRVLSGGAERDLIKIENLCKVYQSGRKQLLAVDRLCVGIPRGECFGFLGVNGAGKTTTFKMLTGDTHVTSGDATVNTYSIIDQIRKVNQSIGYCPQFDALDDLLTGREHLKFYASLRGVPSEYLDRMADWGIQHLGLMNYADKKAGTYSGGNKRKLSTAIALVGNPPVVFLDEPTSGMDPKSRRFLWNCITNIVKEGRSVVLTTHSMEECEALCTRLAIMVNGRFKCLGSIQHLKNKFGDGYTLTIRAASSLVTLEPIQDFIRHNFPMSYLREIHLNMLEYQLPTQNTTLSSLFGIMEENRSQLGIEDYSISQTTLDQVFISFAKQQKTGDEDSIESTTVEPSVHFNSPVALSPGFESSAASVHIPDLGNVSTVPTEALPNRNYYSHTPGYSNPLYTIPGSPPTAEEEDDADTSSLNLQEFGNFSEA